MKPTTEFKLFSEIDRVTKELYGEKPMKNDTFTRTMYLRLDKDLNIVESSWEPKRNVDLTKPAEQSKPSDTPETDALSECIPTHGRPNNDWVPTDFARSLERSRNELLEALKELAQMAQDDAVIYDEQSAWRPFYLIHAEKILAAISSVEKGEK